MKIGEFAGKHKIAIDTVRFYVNEGLLIPIKNGYHYQFDQQCSDDLTNILLLKNAGFSLQEIKNLILSENISTYAVEDWRNKSREIFLKKQQELDASIAHLTHARQFIEERLYEMEQVEEKPDPLGIHLGLLPFLSCPRCDTSLCLQSGRIEQNQIITGALTCPSCHHTMEIEDGILLSDFMEHVIRNYSSYDHFITQADPNLMVSILQNVKWMSKHLYQNSPPIKIVVEIGSGFGFFLRNTCRLIPEDALYVAIDCDINRQRFLKRALQNSGCKKNICLIRCELSSIPLKSGVADQLIDFGASTDLAWYRPEFTLESVDRLTHPGTSCIFVNRAYERFVFNSPVKPEYRKNLVEKTILEKLKNLDYEIMEMERLDFLEKLQPSNQFMNHEDSVYKLLISMKKRLYPNLPSH